MNLPPFSKSKAFKILLPAVILVGIYVIFEAGFDFGRWLFAVIH
jgi:hypothetical protein